MTRAAAALTAVLLLLTGCGKGDQSEPERPAPTSAAPTTGSTESSEVLTIGYGQLGPAKVGMTKADALATGVFDDDLPAPVDGCPAPPLAWKKPFKNVDVLLGDDERIVSMGVSGPGPETRDGIGVGSTLAQVKDAYPDLIGPEGAGYGQAGAYAQSGDRWIGFLFGEANETNVDDESTVTFIELTQGERKPDLMRDGC
jgi:hypothetical protein